MARAAEESISGEPFFAMVAAENPHPMLHELRREDPVHWVEQDRFWLLTRHDDVLRFLHEPELVGHDGRLWEGYRAPPEGSMLRWFEENGFFTLPPDRHARVRRAVLGAFTPSAVRRMEGHIRDVVARFAAPLMNRNGEVIDLLAQFLDLIPNAVISRLTGVASGDDDSRFRQLVASALRGVLPFAPPEIRAESEKSFTELSAWLRDIVGSRRIDPRSDLVSDLASQEGSDALSDDEIVLVLAGIISGGSETTAVSANCMIKTVLDAPEIAESLRRDRGAIASSIDELMRFSIGGATGPVRFAKRDFTVRGKQIRRGQMLMLSTGGANHDPSVYPDPDILFLDRIVKHPVVFGNGPHYCLGAALARHQLERILDAVLHIVPAGSRVRRDKLQSIQEGPFRRTLNLPVEIGVL